MILDALLFSHVASLSPPSFRTNAIRSLIDFLEKKLGVMVVYNARHVPFGRPDLIEAFALAKTLQEQGILKSFSPTSTFPDEPPLKLWGALDYVGDPAGGASSADEASALLTTLAETLERYIWRTEEDYFVSPVRATSEEISAYGPFIGPERFTSFSIDQRSIAPELQLDRGSSYLWIKGLSLVNNSGMYIPAQTMSGIRGIRSHGGKIEPLIRVQITTGLATWPTIEGARLAGALEVIEREAYMIMWLNQLSLPRISLSKIRGQNSSLSELIDTCERYRLKIHAIRLITDAPTHAVCVIVEDESGAPPRFAVGLKAHRSLPYAIEKAMTEALRARVGYRRFFSAGNTWNPKTPVHEVGHRERLYYWGVEENARKLEFMIEGEEKEIAPAPWENDTPEEHLRRVIDWCRDSGYECVSISLGKSAKNPTPWHIEMVAIPELQPTHLIERYQQLGGERWRSVPQQFNLVPREKPFSEAPHPFS